MKKKMLTNAFMMTLFCFSSFASASETKNIQCYTTLSDSNIQELNMTLHRDEDNVTLEMEVSGDRYIKNKKLTSTNALPVLRNGKYQLSLSLDPYAGEVGNLQWLIAVPSHFFSPSLKNSFQPLNPKTYVTLSWSGESSGAGNNSKGKINLYCRSL